jgi:hydroxymethylpyrimidine pyrophosphatase-like HAD family hydrolase
VLKHAGHAAAPANCTSQVKDMAEYVSPFSEAAGVADIIEHYAGLGDR